MDIAKLLLLALGIMTVVYAIYLIRDIMTHKEEHLPVKMVPVLLIGLLANFFDTLGIGSFATSTTAFKFTKSCEDDLIPGTMNVAYAIPIAVEAFVFIQRVEIDPLTLILMIGASIVGAVVGASIISKWDINKVRVALGCAMITLGIIMICKLIGFGPFGIVGTASILRGPKLVIGVVINFVLGALMMVGVGLYAPCMALCLLLGLSADMAFPIMMGSCAFLMPPGSIPFIKSGKYHRGATIPLIISGIIGVLIACFVITSLPLTVLTWVVVCVMFVCSIIFFNDAKKGKK
ncbi:MAG: TSUP family transporter [Dorea sp.]